MRVTGFGLRQTGNPTRFTAASMVTYVTLFLQERRTEHQSVTASPADTLTLRKMPAHLTSASALTAAASPVALERVGGSTAVDCYNVSMLLSGQLKPPKVLTPTGTWTGVNHPSSWLRMRRCFEFTGLATWLDGC